MKKSIHRFVCCLFAVLILCVCFPLSAFAVDPVSAGVMANAFAQAIAAYGASNGVAMTFDVSSTDGIGESMHELWKDFRNGTQDADDYASLAAALFPELYYKASVALGAASDVYTVGYNISSTYAEEFDNFYNWLLSGPAEMTKVDNQYFQFSQAQIGSEATPISVLTVSDLDLYIPFYGPLSVGDQIPTWDDPDVITSVSGSVYYFIIKCSINNSKYVIYFSPSSSSSMTIRRNDYYGHYINVTCVFNSELLYYDAQGNGRGFTPALYQYAQSNNNTYVSYAGSLPASATCSSWSNITLPYDASNTGSSASTTSPLGVKAYGNTGVAEFPDTADPNYQATQKRIPSTIPWDDSLFGDGTGTLTDAQSGAIAAEGDAVIDTAGVLDIAGEREATDEPGTDDPPSTDPDDYTVVGLADLFPFCIPFDIYNFLSALAAEPVAPHFTCTLNFPAAIGGQQAIDIDFDAPTWNQLAQLLRLLELLAFIVGLALLTRSMFIRG